MTGPSRARGLAWLLMGLVITVILVIVLSSLLQRPAPPGLEIVGKPVPAKHPAGPCYECHKGMATGAEIQGKRVPAPHPTEQCSQCHAGYQAGPDSPREPIRDLPPSGGGP
jgi:hypothetical protein